MASEEDVQGEGINICIEQVGGEMASDVRGGGGEKRDMIREQVDRVNENIMFKAAMNGDWMSVVKPSKRTQRLGVKYLLEQERQYYFDLAFQIVLLHQDFVRIDNEEGITPLHLLASKPSAFESGSRLGPLHRIIYNYVLVDPPKKESRSLAATDEMGLKYPRTYKTYVDFFNVFTRLRHVVGGGTSETDAKNSAEVNYPSGGAHVDRGSSKQNNPLNMKDGGKQGTHQLLPPNYFICLNFFGVVMKALLVILGLGITSVRKIKEEKEKHTWAMQLMGKLIENAQYENNGRNPYQSHKKKR